MNIVDKYKSLVSYLLNSQKCLNDFLLNLVKFLLVYTSHLDYSIQKIHLFFSATNVLPSLVLLLFHLLLKEYLNEMIKKKIEELIKHISKE